LFSNSIKKKFGPKWEQEWHKKNFDERTLHKNNFFFQKTTWAKKKMHASAMHKTSSFTSIIL
jgi:hypothetical protein